MVRSIAIVAAMLGMVGGALANDRVSYFPVKQGSGPHDVAVSADGKAAWYSGQRNGTLNPKTGKHESWKSPRRGTYGITVTPTNEVWYVALAGDHLGRIDKKTGEVMIVEPHKKGAGPRRVWTDSKGLLWVSFWHSGEVGVYDPAAKTWKTWLLPGNPGSGCYSVHVDEQDKVWLTDFMTNAIVRFDPKTEKFESFPSSQRGAQVRQMLGRPAEAWGAESGNSRLVRIRY